MADILLDTSAWVSAARRDPAFPPVAMGRRRAIASSLAVAELASLAAQGRVEPAALGHLLATVHLEHPTTEDLAAAGDLHGTLRGDRASKASLIDCIAYQSARRLGVPLLTRDRDLLGQPGIIVF